MLKPVTRYECSWCKQLFKTSNRHKCKLDPELKNCYSCTYCQRYDRDVIEIGPYGDTKAIWWPVCEKELIDPDTWEDKLLAIREHGYAMNCEGHESRFPDPEQEEQIPGQVELEEVLDEQNTDWLEEVLNEQNEN